MRVVLLTAVLLVSLMDVLFGQVWQDLQSGALGRLSHAVLTLPLDPVSFCRFSACQVLLSLLQLLMSQLVRHPSSLSSSSPLTDCAAAAAAPLGKGTCNHV
jgi:hypothetical protein